MTEPAAPPADRSAGAMLRAARERQGLHIAALSAAIKVPQSKLEALEAGRYDELTDATFVRALAHSVCRVLKIDPKPVLDQLPIAHSTLLERAEHDLRAPFRERGAHETSESRLWHQPVFWLVVLLLVAAAAFVLWPSRANLSLKWLSSSGSASEADAPPAPSPAASTPAAAPPAAMTAAAPVPEPAASAAAPMVSASPVAAEAVRPIPSEAASGVSTEAPSGLAVVRAREPSWVEARDARGNLLVSRTLQSGESVGLEGPVPLKLVIGNASATEVTMRGKRVTLGPPNRDNVVKVELK